MLSIAVCDDNVGVCSEIEQIALDYSKKKAIPIHVEVYFSGESLFEDLGKFIYYDLIFLDIVFQNKSSGIDIGMRIRNELNLEFTEIVFMSSYAGYALELFKIHPMDFLVKPIGETYVIKLLERAMKQQEIFGNIFSFQKDRSWVKLMTRDIMYFKSCGQIIEVYTKTDHTWFYGILKKVYEQLREPEGTFLFCHRSYIVNYFYISKFNGDSVILTNEKRLPIAQKRRKEIRRIQQDNGMKSLS